MIIDYNVNSKIDISIFEDYDAGDHYKYETNAKVTWNILNVEILEDTIKFKVVRTSEDDQPSEVYDNSDNCGYYTIKCNMTFWFTISKNAINESLRQHDSVKAEILDCSDISTELIDAKYVSGAKLSKEQIVDFLDGPTFEGESILVSAEIV